MPSASGTGKKRSLPESETSRAPDERCKSGILTDSIHALGVSDSYPRQGQGNEETPGLGDHAPPSPGCTDENQEIVITSIRATDVALGLRRFPAGFYIVVHYNGIEWRTENQRSLVNHDVVEWSGSIHIPSDLSVTVRLEVYASFEFQPTLGAGEQLRILTTTVEQLLDRSAKGVPFSFFPNDGDIVSPCSSVLVTIERRKCENNNSSASRVLTPHRSTAGSRGLLEDVTNKGHDALSRYRKYGRKQDLERSIQDFEVALCICPLDYPCRAAAQCNLAMAKLILCQVEDMDASFDTPLRLYRNALAARPVGHLDRPSTLIQLAMVHLARLEKRRDHVEGTRAEALLHEAMRLGSTESYETRAANFMRQLHAGRKVGPGQPGDQSLVEQDSTSRLTDEDLQTISLQLLDRFEQLGDLADLQRAITILEGLVKSTAVWDDRYHSRLGNLGVALWYRFKHLGELPDLEGAISRQKEAIDHTPHGHPDKPLRLNNLGISLISRFERFGELSDLEDAISRQRDAVDLTPHGHPGRPARLSNLGASLITRFERLGELSDLEDAIQRQRDAVALTPHSHPKKPSRLSDLGTSLRTRFKRLDQLSDLEDAISMQREAVGLTPYGHPDTPSCLKNLGNSFRTRFEHLGRLSDLEDAVSMLRGAVHLTPHSHPDKPPFLSNLGISFRTRFVRLGHLADLEEAISAFRDAVHLTPHSHPGKPVRLNHLGNTLRTRFERLGELSDLKDAILALKDAVDLFPHGDPDRSACLDNLGISFAARFRRLGRLRDLEDAISAQKNSVDITPHGLDKPRRLNSLGTSLITRFERLGQMGDLDDAISMHRDAVDLTPQGHPDKPAFLSNLGTSLITRFERLGEPSDLEDAIQRQRDAVALTPHGHPKKPSRLSDLGTSFRTRFECLDQLSDLEDAISMQREAVDLTPYGHSDTPGRLNNLGISFRTRFDRLGQLGDLEDAISRHREAVDLAPHGHPLKFTYLNNLGISFRTRFERFGDLRDLKRAISLYSHAASAPICPINIRFPASRNWISCARQIRHHSLLRAYSVALSLLPQLAWIGLSLTDRYDQLTQGANVVREAAAAALDSGRPDTAVEWLEQGRSIVWEELFQLRSSFEELSSAHPDHAHRLRELSAVLNHTGAIREKSLSAFSEQTQGVAHRVTESSAQMADRHRALAIERDQLLQDIRQLPGFEQFLLRKPFAQLRASAHSGPVVILNAAETRCDALIILADVDHVIHVPLPSFTFKRSVGLQNMLEKLLGHAHAIPCDDRKGDPSPRGGVSWQPLLSTLWTGVVKPVLDALAFPTPGDLSRIFWCPTGPFTFLPIHAAGLYDALHLRPGYKLSDFVVSSYVPTLSILEPSPRPTVSPSGDLRLLAVRQPPSDGLPSLPGATTELKHIREVIQMSPSAHITLMESSVGTVEEVLDLMRKADWVHFACHGIQEDVNSGLCLANGRRLKLRDIVALSRPRGGLAFLSACQTATGDEGLSDEAIHVAAGMLYAGYGGVVGTMWSISDRLAPVVARDVYERLLGNGTRPDYREAAHALHEAIGGLRDRNASFVEWVPFIHVGL